MALRMTEQRSEREGKRKKDNLVQRRTSIAINRIDPGTGSNACLDVRVHVRQMELRAEFLSRFIYASVCFMSLKLPLGVSEGAEAS